MHRPHRYIKRAGKKDDENLSDHKAILTNKITVKHDFRMVDLEAI